MDRRAFCLVCVSAVWVAHAGASDLDYVTEAWTGVFRVKSVRWSESSGRMTWELETLREGDLKSYLAVMTDADGVEIAQTPVTFLTTGKVKPGMRVQAGARFSGFTAGEAARIVIRVKP